MMFSRTGWMLKATALAALVSICITPRLAAAADYQLQPDDVVSIRVSGESALSQNYTLDEHGDIVMDQVGKVRLAGLDEKQAKEKITTELSKYLKLFEISLTVVGETGARALVYGEVARSGMVKLRPDAKLLDALAEAGQPTVNADRKRISVSKKAGGKTETFDLDEVLKNPTLNIPINPGDTITVPPKASRAVQVDGEVAAPGFKPYEDAKTALAAVKAANPTDKADWTRVALRKKGSDIPVMLDLSEARQGVLKQDFPLDEGDHLTILSKFSGTATVRGEVKTPGQKDLDSSIGLWDLIQTQAGGFSDRANKRQVQVIRKDSSGEKKVRTVDLVAVERGAKRSDDPELEVLPGDLVFVPAAIVNIQGEVNTKGERALGTADNLWDLIQNVAGGFTEKADKTSVQIKRDGKVVRTADLELVANGKKSSDDPDYKVEAGDEIFVPNNDLRCFVIVGGVSKPGRIPVQPGMTLLDAVAAAGNFTANATKKQFVVAPASRFGPDGKLQTPTPTEKKAKKDDPSAYGLVVIDVKKLMKGDATQNVAINPGDRILVPEELPQQAGKKPSFLQSILRMVPLAGMFMGGYGGYGGYGYGGY